MVREVSPVKFVDVADEAGDVELEVQPPVTQDGLVDSVDPAGRLTDSATGLRRAVETVSPEHTVELGRYTVIERIGSGGLGVVYRALDRERNQVVALKTLGRLDPTALFRLKSEFRNVADVTHPNLVTLHELVGIKETWFFTMELVVDATDFVSWVRGPGWERPSESLQWYSNSTTLVAKPPRLNQAKLETPPPSCSDPTLLDVEKLRHCLRQLVTGVNALHESSLLHLDLKPGNVLVDKTGRVVILDFGLARDSDQEVQEGLHKGPRIAGTPAYMAPEQAYNRRLTEASDWYAVGVMLYEALTGRLPFSGNIWGVLTRKVRETPPPPCEIVPDLPPDLNQLCIDLLSTRAVDRPSAQEVLKRVGGARPQHREHLDQRRLIGRAAELRTFWEAFERTSDGATIAVEVSGLSGMGKTALVEHFLHDVRNLPTALTLSSRCYERETVPFKAFDALVDTLASVLANLPGEDLEAIVPKHKRELARMFPVLQTVKCFTTKEKAVEIPDRVEARRRAFAALKQLLCSLGERNELVIHIDDLQWGDYDSARLLNQILSPPSPPRVLLLLTYRTASDESSVPTYQSPLSAESEAACEIVKVHVGPLDIDETGQLALELLGSDGAATFRRARAIADEAEGIPLFVEALVQYALLDPASSDESEGRRLSLEQVLRERMKRLQDSDRRLLEVLAVAGRPMEQQIALDACFAEGDYFSVVGRLRQAFFIRSGGARTDDRLELYHDRVRSTLLDKLTDEQLKGHHKALAERIELTGNADARVLARHFHGAGEFQTAADFMLTAADEAGRALAFSRAADLYERVMEWSAEALIEPRFELHHKFATALFNAGRLPEAARARLDCADHAKNDWERLEQLNLSVPNFIQSGLITDGVAVLKPLLTELGLSFPSTPRRTLFAALGSLLALKVKGTKFTARDPALVSNRVRLQIAVCTGAGTSFSAVDPMMAAMFTLKGLRIALKAGVKTSASKGLGYYGLALAWPGKPKAVTRARKLIARALALAKECDDQTCAMYVLLCKGVVDVATGEWARGVEVLSETTALIEEHSVAAHWEWTTAIGTSIVALMWAGELKRAMAMLDVFHARCTDAGDALSEASYRGYKAVGLLTVDEPRAAADLIDPFLANVHDEGAHFQTLVLLLSRVWIMLYENEPGQALDLVRRFWPALRKARMNDLQLMKFYMLTMRAGATLNLALVDEENRSKLLKAAAKDTRRLAKEKRGYLVAASELFSAGIAFQRSQRDECLASLNRALAGFESENMALHHAAALRRKGEMLEGDDGARLRDQADVVMRAQGILKPARWTRILAPGWTDFEEPVYLESG